MILTAIIAILTCVCLIISVLIFPKIHIKNITIETYWIVCLFGAVLMLLCGSISFNELWNTFSSNTSVNPIKILVLFFSMTLLSIYLDEIGFFHMLAVRATKVANKNQKVLFCILYLLTSFLTIFTSNDIVILTLTPFICYFCKNEDIDPIPYLVAEFSGANTWSMMLMIGNPTNIYLATSAEIDFMSYLKVMVLPTFLAGIVEMGLIFVLFRKKLSVPMHIKMEHVQVEDKGGLIIGLIHLIVCLILMVISSYTHLEMWLISLSCAINLFIFISLWNVIRKKKQEHLLGTLKRAPYALIPFVLSMFIIVTSLKVQGISSYLASFLGNDMTIMRYGVASFLFSNVMNNIPMSVLFSTLPSMQEGLDITRAIYATIIGSNIGAFLTPIGALAGIMFTELLDKQNVQYGFTSFVKYGVAISIPTLVSALFMLDIVLTFLI